MQVVPAGRWCGSSGLLSSHMNSVYFINYQLGVLNHLPVTQFAYHALQFYPFLSVEFEAVSLGKKEFKTVMSSLNLEDIAN